MFLVNEKSHSSNSADKKVLFVSSLKSLLEGRVIYKYWNCYNMLFKLQEHVEIL